MRVAVIVYVIVYVNESTTKRNNHSQISISENAEEFAQATWFCLIWRVILKLLLAGCCHEGFPVSDAGRFAHLQKDDVVAKMLFYLAIC